MSLPLDVAPVIDAFRVGTLTATRQGARVKSASGVYGPGATTSITLSPVATHPLSGRDLEQYPEADRLKGMRAFYTRVQLKAAGDASDFITYEGERWRVVNVYRAGDIGDSWIVHTVRLEANAP